MHENPARRILGTGFAGGKAIFGSAALAAAMIFPILPWTGGAPAQAQDVPDIPDFHREADTGWISLSNDYIPSESGPASVTFDPLHPYVGNRQALPASFRVADLTNPNVKPWALETMKAPNDGVIAGGMGFTPRSACMHAGLPTFLLFVREPVFIFQGKDEVLIVYSGDSQIRRIHMNVPHAADPKPSWYGDSVGHYESGALVIDTIGLDTRSYVDHYRTPHSENLHVMERWSMNEAGDVLNVHFTVEDEKTFYAPWSASMRYGRSDRPMEELICAENNRFDEVAGHKVPVAAKLDF